MLIVRCCSLFAGCWMLVDVWCLLCDVFFCLMFVVGYLLFVARCPCVVFVVCCSLCAVRVLFAV